MKHNPIICAIDNPELSNAKNLAKEIAENVGMIKLGLEFFIANGKSGVSEIISDTGAKIFLDLKLHDIPNTVAAGIREVSKMNVELATIHASNGGECIKQSASELKNANSNTKLIAVTILTSFADIAEIGMNDKIESQVLRLAELSIKNGADGIVCSPWEIEALRKNFGNDFILVTPGIRPEGDEVGDQKRIMTPKQAVLAGANYIVIGRPITKSQTPKNKCIEIYNSIL